MVRSASSRVSNHEATAEAPTEPEIALTLLDQIVFEDRHLELK
jgi:hypothetical protein